MIDPNISKDDKKFLKLALNLARRNVGLTGKNPSVGCIITFKDIIIGRGNTQLGGRPHAEIMAIKQASDHPLLRENPDRSEYLSLSTLPERMALLLRAMRHINAAARQLMEDQEPDSPEAEN